MGVAIAASIFRFTSELSVLQLFRIFSSLSHLLRVFGDILKSFDASFFERNPDMHFSYISGQFLGFTFLGRPISLPFISSANHLALSNIEQVNPLIFPDDRNEINFIALVLPEPFRP